MVFSLGNTFQPVPLDRAIALDVLLQPLQPNPEKGVGAVVQHLLTESNHPPLYFVLAHWWMQLFPTSLTSSDNGGMEAYVSVWAARSLPAVLGAASIPAVYGLSWLAFRSKLVSQLTAAMMAVSPYGIFIAQEARHYTLAILWVIASLSCLVIAIRHIRDRTSLPVWLNASWIGINTLGIATHYFFSLSLCAEALVLIAFLILDCRFAINPRSPIPNLKSLCAVAAGTLVGGVVWLPVFWQNSYNSQLTQWIHSDERVGLLAWVSPVFQALAGWIAMLSLLPVEATALPVVIASGGVMLIYFIWAVPILSRGITTQLQLDSRIATQLFLGVVCSAITLFFIITYGFGIDLTRGARYNFVYFPAVIVLVGASLAACWNTSSVRTQKNTPHLKTTGKPAVVLIWLMGLVSAITVVCNLGYQKYYRPDLLVPVIQEQSKSPVFIATTQETHVQIGEMMGVAWEFKLSGSPATPQFLLAHQDQNPNTSTAALQRTLNQLPRPLDLWLVNFHAPEQLNSCVADTQSFPLVDGYDYKHYYCDRN